MAQITVIIERAENNFSAYVQEIDGIAATGRTVDEIKASVIDAIEEYISACSDLNSEIPAVLRGQYEIVFQMDIESLLKIYDGIFTKSGLERLTGINQKQLWHYANGISKPRQAQKQKIETALHRLGSELISLSL